MRTRTKFVIAAFSALICYFIAETVLLVTIGQGYPAEFTRCWFIAWTVELGALAGIKIADRKSPYGQVIEEVAE